MGKFETSKRLESEVQMLVQKRAHVSPEAERLRGRVSPNMAVRVLIS